MRMLRACGRGLACLVFLALPWLSGCSLGQAARTAGGDAALGGIEAARKWWADEGRQLAEDKAAALAGAVATQAKEAAVAKAEEEVEKLGKKVEAGEATPMEKALYLLAGLAGVGGAAGHLRPRPGSGLGTRT